MTNRFDYILERLVRTPLASEPYSHLYIEDLLTQDDFCELTSSTDVKLEPFTGHEELLTGMRAAGYAPIPFPGCITSETSYLKWLQDGSRVSPHEACEGFGMAYRLSKPKAAVVASLDDFFKSHTFHELVRDKFEIPTPTKFDGGLHKYLHGYEISPHPDIRSKALTWMMNINPDPNSDTIDFHTHYMKFRSAYRFVGEFWEGNPEVEREWIPWDWCETVKQQSMNNSLVIFRPNNWTLHGVKARYDHCSTQRTQFYGNL